MHYVSCHWGENGIENVSFTINHNIKNSNLDEKSRKTATVQVHHWAWVHCLQPYQISREYMRYYNKVLLIVLMSGYPEIIACDFLQAAV